MTANDASIGFDMIMTFDGANENFSGTFCANDENISFASLEELETIVDPTGTCEDAFGGTGENNGDDECNLCVDDCESTGLDESTCLETCIDEGICS